jgi:protein phosphatase
MAVEAFEAGLPDSGGSPEQRLAAVVRAANRKIFEHAQSDEARSGMGTTVSVAYVGEDEVALAHVGDSRVYVLRDGGLERLTSDHSLVGEWVRQGRLSEEEAEDHPQRSIITRALGPEPDVDVDTRTYPAQAGDVFLLCSDGLTSMVAETRVAEILRGASSLEEAGRELVEQANEAGGRDNITVILFRLEDVAMAGKPGEAAPTVVAPTVAAEQPTKAGDDAPSADEVRAAAATATAERPLASKPTSSAELTGVYRSPIPPLSPPVRRRRRGRRALMATLVVLAILVPVLVGGWFATRAVYFVGTNDEGLVTVFRGVPFDLPAGIHLYQTEYVSGVPASVVPPARRRKLLDHKLRSQSDAADLVRLLEEGRIQE